MKIYELTISSEIPTDAIAIVSSHISPRHETHEYYSTQKLAESRRDQIHDCAKIINMSGTYPKVLIAEITVMDELNIPR